MNRNILILIIAVLFSLVQNAEGQSKLANKGKSVIYPNGKWTSLFNGKNLDGWTLKVTGSKPGENPLDGFRVEDGILKIDYSKFYKFNGRYGHLFYKEKLSSYILHVEYRFVGVMLPDAPSFCYRNSGVMVHSQSPESMDIEQNWPVSIEVQLLGSTDSVKQTTANFCTPGTTVYFKDQPTDEHCISSNSKYFPDGEWVNLDIIVEGGKAITNIVNGETVLVCSKPQIGGYLLPKNYPLPEGTLLENGYIALQSEGQPLEFRRVELKKMVEK
jgi:hypothetical protein